MKRLQNMSGKLKTTQIAAAVIILLIVVITMVAVKLRTTSEDEALEYTYNNVVEQVLADEVAIYLQDAAGLGDVINVKTGNEAVETYRSIVRSDVDVVNEDHTQAIQMRISKALKRFTEEDGEELTAEDISALSAGITERIWQTILSQIENAEESKYIYLAESLQEQIDDLENRKMKVTIKANINSGSDMSADDLLAMVEGMSDSELKDLARAMGFSYDELNEMINSAGKDSTKEFENRLETLKREIISELKKEITRELAGWMEQTEGMDATDVTDRTVKTVRPQDRKAGADGKAGSDGKTTYIAYADDVSGKNFSLSPLETSKYIGTCITDEKTQPTSRSAYGNWQIYRSHVITETTENGVTTVHIY